MERTPLILLHGAIGSKTQFALLAQRLSDRYTIYSPDFPGHGGAESVEAFSIESLSAFVKEYIHIHRLEKPWVFGYSMGGYVALHLASQEPEIFAGIITLATKFNWNEATAAAETRMLQPEKIEEKVPKFAELLAARHYPQDWKDVLRRTAAMLTHLGAHPALTQQSFAGISTPVLLVVGDRDQAVSIEETIAVYSMLPNATLSVLPKTAHPIEQANIDWLELLLREAVLSTNS